MLTHLMLSPFCLNLKTYYIILLSFFFFVNSVTSVVTHEHILTGLQRFKLKTKNVFIDWFWIQYLRSVLVRSHSPAPSYVQWWIKHQTSVWSAPITAVMTLYWLFTAHAVVVFRSKIALPLSGLLCTCIIPHSAFHILCKRILWATSYFTFTQKI